MKIIHIVATLFLAQRTVAGENDDYDDYEEDYEDYGDDDPEGGSGVSVLCAEDPPEVLKCCPKGEVVVKVGDIFECIRRINPVFEDASNKWIPDDFVHGHDEECNKTNQTKEYELKFSDIPLSGNESLCHEEDEEVDFWEPDHIVTNRMAPRGLEMKLDFFKCVDRLLEGGNIKERPVVFGCKVKDKGQDQDRIMRIVLTVAWFLGIICLLVALVVYLVLPSKRNLQGQLVTCNMMSTLGVTIFLILVYQQEYLNNSIKCKIIGYVGYFLTIAMFTWMTVLCMDVFWTFVRPRVMSGSGTGKRLVFFHCLGWGLPSLLTVLAVLLDHLEVANSPGIGTHRCFVKNESSLFYLHIPITLLITINLILYVVTVSTIARIRSAAKGSNKSEQVLAREQFILFTKLFVVMGLLWVAESLQYYISKITGDQIRAVRTIFDILSVLNMLRGVFIFLIFVCKVSVWNGLKKLGKKKNYNEQTTKFLSSRRLEKSSTSVPYSTTYVSTTQV